MAVQQWQATRSAGLAQLATFLPHAGRAYAAKRNYDTGVGSRSNVSCLSPWIRHRLILEEEVLEAVLREHSASAAQKFIQELCWRTYWKGWLEMRPQIWQNYRKSVDTLKAKLTQDAGLCRRWKEATSGQTGIDCFDHWTIELIETGYLHNHTRMWFASIWVFTLGLPWELGADFFLRQLLDGDAASNTLSWRWVAGLQTVGKTYLARAENIARYTQGRFRPHGQLSERAEPPNADPTVAPRVLPAPTPPAADSRTGLLLTEDDLVAESLDFPRPSVVAVAAYVSCAKRSPWPVSQNVIEFSTAALSDGARRAAHHLRTPPPTLLQGDLATQLIAWCEHHNLAQVVVPYVPVGSAREALDAIEAKLDRHRIRLAQIRRPWDEQLWPHATHGYFRFRKAINAVVDRYRPE